jgi:hypothetical protein
MAESFAERLSRFTPDSSALDRDALLFAAGRASARRSNRFLGVLTGALAAAQLLTLVLLWPAPRPASLPVADRSISAELASADAPPVAMDEASVGTLSRRALQSANEDLPREKAVEQLVATGPALRAAAASSWIGLD